MELIDNPQMRLRMTADEREYLNATYSEATYRGNLEQATEPEARKIYSLGLIECLVKQGKLEEALAVAQANEQLSDRAADLSEMIEALARPDDDLCKCKNPKLRATAGKQEAERETSRYVRLMTFFSEERDEFVSLWLCIKCHKKNAFAGFPDELSARIHASREASKNAGRTDPATGQKFLDKTTEDFHLLPAS